MVRLCVTMKRACTAMKIRTAEYFIKEGFGNIWKNQLMSLASIGTVVASLIIFGIFILFNSNVNYIGQQIQNQQVIKAFIDESMTEEQVEAIGQQIKAIENVEKCELETKAQALENFKEQLGEDNEVLLEGLEQDNPLRDSYIITAKDISHTEQIITQLELIEGIVNIKGEIEVVDLLQKVTNSIQMVSLGIMAVLVLISIFIISNTIKLTVFARRKEINIMKFVGATDWFIRWPFIVEGIIIGFIGAIFALILIGYGYNYTINFIYQNTMIFQLRSISSLLQGLTLIFVLLGISIGTIGSAISIRKYLRV